MHTPETRQKFVERRAQGWSLVRLASELGVARSTLIEWSRQLRF
jgi:transposase-like protein